MKPLKKIREITEQLLDIPNLAEPNRTRNNIHARAIYYEVAKNFTNSSLKKIGAEINRDHATVIHGLNNFKLYSYHEPKFIKHYELVKENFIPVEDCFINGDKDLKDLNIKYRTLQFEYDNLLKKQQAQEKKLKDILKHDEISNRLVEIYKDLNSKQIEQMFERMESFAQICNYHNQKKKVL